MALVLTCLMIFVSREGRVSQGGQCLSEQNQLPHKILAMQFESGFLVIFQIVTFSPCVDDTLVLTIDVHAQEIFCSSLFCKFLI